MKKPPPKRARVSQWISEGTTDDANNQCHNVFAFVDPNDKRILGQPRIVPIFWGSFYISSPGVISNILQLLTDIVTGPFMNGLAQYGIDLGTVAPAVMVSNSISPPPTTLSRELANVLLQAWISTKIVAPAPAINESRLLYCIFPPPGTTLTLDDVSNFCGYHYHDQINDDSGNDDLFWLIVSVPNNKTLSAFSFVNSIAFCIGHELVESFTDRDGSGYLSEQGCEIGDLCEVDRSGKIFTFPYRGWNLERYWSMADLGCIQGNKSVSLRWFLAVMNIDPSVGIRQLGTSVVNLAYVARRMR